MSLLKQIKFQYHAWRLNRLRDASLNRPHKYAVQRHGQSGFTLIELMISVLIIALLAAIAIPAYASYAVKAAGSEGVRMLDGAEAAIAESYNSNGVAPGNSAEAGVQQGAGKYVQSLNVGTGGAIWATFLPTAPGGLAGNSVTITPYLSGADPSSPIVWVCGYASPQAGWVPLTVGTVNPVPATSIAANLLPRVCRAGG